MTLERLATRQRTLLPFGVIGLCCVIAGGLLAAAVAYTPTEHEVWAVAYLVLVPGVAQVALGTGQALLAPQAPTRASFWAQLATFNVGNALVIAGTVTGRTAVTDLGGLLLVVSLALFLVVARGGHAGIVRWVYRALITLVLVSVPVGLVIQHATGK